MFTSCPFVGPAHTAALRSAALLTLALDPDQDPDPDQDHGLTLILPVDPVHALTAGLIPVLLILDATGAVTDAHDRDPALVQGLTGIGAPAHRGLLPRSGEEAGRDPKQQDPTGQGHGLAHRAASGAAAPADGSHLLER